MVHMVTDTHCLTSGALGTSELPVPNISAANNIELVPASGLKRGVVVLCHGLDIVRIDPPYSMTGDLLTFAQDLQADGWVVIVPPYPEDNFGSLPTTGLFNDVNADAAHGARYLATTLHWWDHVVDYAALRFGAWPIVPFGLSWGGWHAVKVAKHKPSTIVAYGAHEPVTVLSQLLAAFTTPVDFTALNTTGLDVASSDLNAVTLPGIIGWGTADTVVGSTNAQALYNAAHTAGRPVTSNATAEMHGWVAADTTAYLAWFTGTVDPLCPKVF